MRDFRHSGWPTPCSRREVPCSRVQGTPGPMRSSGSRCRRVLPSETLSIRLGEASGSVLEVRIRFAPPRNPRLPRSLWGFARWRGDSRDSAGFWRGRRPATGTETAGGGPGRGCGPCSSPWPSRAVRFRFRFGSRVGRALLAEFDFHSPGTSASRRKQAGAVIGWRWLLGSPLRIRVRGV